MSIRTAVDLLKKRRTKIVATLGPASSDAARIDELLGAGVDVFRLNFSHGDHPTHAAVYERVRAAAARRGTPTLVLADLCGPKIRTGTFAGGGIELVPGQPVTVTTRDIEGAPGLIPSQYKGLAADVKPGNRIIFGDGDIELRVEGVAGSEVGCRVVHGGTLRNRKGINLPGVAVSTASITDKDRADALFALGLGVDFLALSFVRSAADVLELKELVARAGGSVGVLAKIEKAEALEDIDAILDAADAIMVARGDLGIELPPEKVPLAQDLLVNQARQRNKPVVIATQMLESMIQNTRPTRAEVSDVAHAVTSGADAIMLSAETAAGSHPVLAVEMMDRIARQTEGLLWQQASFGGILDLAGMPAPLPVEDAVARATAQLSRDLRVRAIIVSSRSGRSARLVSSARPSAPVVALSTSAAACRRMNLLWGVYPHLASSEDISEMLEEGRRIILQEELACEGEHVLAVRGFSGESDLNSPSVTVLTL